MCLLSNNKKSIENFQPFPFNFNEDFKVAIGIAKQEFIVAINGEHVLRCPFKDNSFMGKSVSAQVVNCEGMEVKIESFDVFEMEDGQEQTATVEMTKSPEKKYKFRAEHSTERDEKERSSRSSSRTRSSSGKDAQYDKTTHFEKHSRSEKDFEKNDLSAKQKCPEMEPKSERKYRSGKDTEKSPRRSSRISSETSAEKNTSFAWFFDKIMDSKKHPGSEKDSEKKPSSRQTSRTSSEKTERFEKNPKKKRNSNVDSGRFDQTAQQNKRLARILHH